MEFIKLPTDMIAFDHEKAFRDLGSGLMTSEKEDFIVICGDN